MASIVIGTNSRMLSGWKDIAAYLGIDEGTARRYHKRHGLPVSKVGNRIFISTETVEDWLLSKR